MDENNKKFEVVKTWESAFFENSPWLVIFFAVILLSTKAAFNLIMVYMVLAGTFLFFRYRYVFINNPCVNYLNLLFLSMWLPMFISLLDSVVPDRSFQSVSAHLGLYFVGLYIVYVGYNSKHMAKLNRAVIYLVLFWCVDALIQFIFGRDLFGLEIGNKLGRLTGMFSPHQRLGYVVAGISPVVWEWTRLNMHRHKWYLFAPDACKNGRDPRR